MSRLLLGLAAAILAFVVTENSASAQLYQRFVPSYGYGYSAGYNTYPPVHVVPGYGTHYHAVPHGDHIDLVPHGNSHHGHNHGHNHYSPYGRSSFSFGYSSGYGGGFGLNYGSGYNYGRCW